MPEYVIRRGSGLWQVPARISIAPDGSVRNCQTEGTSGIADLDKLTCRLIMRRAKFRPARSIDGTPSFGVYRTSVKWIVADAPWDTSKVSNPDIDVTVKRLPAGAKSPSFVRVMFAVDSNGRKSSCMADHADGLVKVENNPVLVPIACAQIMRHYQATPAVDAEGKPLASVQNALVRFSTDRQK